MTTMVAVFEQEHFRIRDDETAADPGTPNWITTEDQATRVVIDTGTLFRARFTIANTGNANTTPTFSVYYKLNAAAYTEVTASSAVQTADASTPTDADAITTANFQLTAGTGTAQDGQYDENGAATQSLNQGDNIELEFCMSIDAAQVADADTIDLRVYQDDTALDVYDFDALIEVNEVAATTPITGTGSFAFTPTSVLKGIGILAGTVAAVFTLASALTGIGVMTGISSPAFTCTGTLTEAETITPISGTGAIVFTPTSDLKGIGVLAGTSAAVFTPSSTLTGIGVLAGTSAAAFTCTGTLTDGAVDFVYIGGGTNDVNDNAINYTHSLTINEGDLVVAWVHRNGANTIVATQTWDHESTKDYAAEGETCIEALFYTIAGASEPATYGWTFSGSDNTRVVFGVWRPKGGASIAVDSPVNRNVKTGQNTFVACDTANGETISDKALSIIVGGRDGRPAVGAYTSATQSYVGVVGSDVRQEAAMAHRIFETGEVFTGEVEITPSTGDDNSYGAHVSFVLSAGGDPITGTGAIVFTPTSALKGIGVLSGTSAGVFTASSALTGIGSLSGTSAAVFTPSSSLTGIGVLTGTSNIVFTNTGTLGDANAGIQPITGTGSITFTPTSDLKGIGALTGSSDAVFSLSSSLKGIGVLAGTTAATFTGTGDLTGIGVLAGTSAAAFTCTSDLKGIGVLAGTSAAVFSPSSVLKGIGVLSGTSNIVFTPTGTLGDAGSPIQPITGTGSITFTNTSDLTGIGVLSGTSAAVFSNSSSLTGIGKLEGSTAITFTNTGDLKGIGVLSGTTSISFTPTGDLKGIGVLAGSVSAIFSPASTLTGIGVLAGASNIVFTGTGTLSEVGGTKVPITGTGAIVFTPTSDLTGIGTLSGVSAAVFSPSSSLKGIGVLTGSSAIVFTTTGTLHDPDQFAGGRFNAIGYLPPGGTVTIALIDADTDTVIALDDNSCIESFNLPGLYLWDSLNLTTQPTTTVQYGWRMTDGTNFDGGDIVFSAEDSARLVRLEEFLRNERVTNPVTGKQTIMDDLGAPKYRGNVFEDVAETIPYRGQGANVAKRLDDV